MAGEHLWHGVCVAVAGMHSRGHVWQGGMHGRRACMAGGHSWWGVCMAGGHACHPHTPHQILRDTINEWEVRILLGMHTC